MVKRNVSFCKRLYGEFMKLTTVGSVYFEINYLVSFAEAAQPHKERRDIKLC